MDPLETSLRGRVADTITRGSEMGYQAMGSVRNTSDDIERTINALFIKKLSEREIRSNSQNSKRTMSSSKELSDSISVSTSSGSRRRKKFSEYMTKIKKKMKIKTKQGERQRMLSSSIKSVTSTNSYECRVKYLAAKLSDKRTLHINVILIDEDTNRNEILPFEFNIRDKISVKELMKKISECAFDPILGNKEYRCLCLDNSFVMECHEPLQSYFLPSKKKNQFAIAVPVGKTCKSIVELAMPIMHKTRRASITKESRGLRESFLISRNGLNDKNAMLPKLLEAAQCDSMQSTNTSSSNATKSPSTDICIPHTVYMILGLIFIYFMHGSSNRDASCS